MHKVPAWRCQVAAALAVLALTPVLWAQSAGAAPDWRPIGNRLFDAGLPSFSSGSIERVWFGTDGSQLFSQTAAGQIWVSVDAETWSAAPSAVPPPKPNRFSSRGVTVAAGPTDSTRLYAFGRQIYRSDDGGVSWSDLTSYGGRSILGAPVADLAVAPGRPAEVVAATRYGIWRSNDGGLSWSGLNDGLLNFPRVRLKLPPAGRNGAVIDAEGYGPLEWAPGEKLAWRQFTSNELKEEAAARDAASQGLGVRLSAFARAPGAWYAGTPDGRIYLSIDEGRNWQLSRPAGGRPVHAIFIVPEEPQAALAALGSGEQNRGMLLRTTNRGLFWDDLAAAIPASSVLGVTADPATTTIYAATDAGLYWGRMDLLQPSPPGAWQRLAGPWGEGPVGDVMLGPGAHLLYAAADGAGIFSAIAPHRREFPQLVSAAHWQALPLAPGALYSFVGGRLDRARAQGWPIPLLAAEPGRTELQIPFEVTGEELALQVEGDTGLLTFPVPLLRTAPAIFVDREGAPMILEEATGVPLDALRPARSGTRIQIFATGLGAVEPKWLAGLPAPFTTPPKVIAPVRAFLERAEVEVTRATLAPGYQGMYLVEVQVPDLINEGPAEFYLETGGAESNRVRLYIAP